MVFNVTFEEIFGAGGGVLQEKTVMPGAQEQKVVPDEGCDALSKVTVAGDADLVAGNIKKDINIFGVVGTYANRLPEQVKTAIPTAAGVEVLPDEGKTLSRVNIPAEPNMVPGNIKDGVNIFGVVGNYETQTEEKSVTPGTQEQEVTPAAGKHLSKVTVAGDADLVANNIRDGVDIFGVTGNLLERKEEQVKNVTPDAAGFDVTPDSGKALSKVVVAGDTNLVASNIKKDVNVFGVTGTYEPNVETQEKSATPGAQAVEVTPDSGKALSKVVVAGDEDLIPANIKAGVNIFGVDGSYMPSESNFATFVEGTTGTIQIPAVTTIRNTCFQNQGHNYLIPGTVEAIGNYAFDGCSGMTQLVLPAGLTSLGPYAFRNCKNIEGDVIIPEAINDIPGAVFYGCSKIPRFEFKSTFTGSGNNHIQAYAFYNCTNCLVYDFTAAESVPALQNINAFNNHNADLRIIVPDALYNDWIAAANWSNSNISEHIIKESEGV